MKNSTLIQGMQRRFSSPLVVVLIAALLMWAVGIPFLMNYASAAALTSVSDTLSDSDLGVLAKHTIAFTLVTAVVAGETIKIQLDTAGDAFSQVFSSATTTDITTSGMTLVDTCAGGSDEVTVIGNYNDGSDENLTFTVCSGDTVGTGAVVVTVGAATLLWTNPGSAGSVIISIGGTMTDSADMRVAIIDDVTVTASVDTSLTFTIAGVSSGGTPANGQAGDLSITSTATAIPFGTLTVGATSTARQDLTVTTNATNGFTVTLQFDQELTSSTGADINLFKDGSGEVTPTAYTAPVGTLDNALTYGHLGFTSADDLNTDEYGTALYAGNGSTTARAIFEHNGPADGSTANKGQTEIGFIIEITALQEAGTDYTAQLTYVATPTF